MSEWRLVDDDTPKNTDILVCVTHNLSEDEWETLQWVDWYVDGVGWSVFYGRIDLPFPPTHWMPLPEPPSED